jgi:hypothetical protein
MGTRPVRRDGQREGAAVPPAAPRAASRRIGRHTALAAAAALLAACTPDRPGPASYRPVTEAAPPARLAQSIELGAGNVAHVLNVPMDQFDRARCVVVTSQAGHVAVSCTEPRLLLSPQDE